ncbi:MAG: rSAM-associated Gly-rich repeat protein [Synechococcus sp. XM-24]|nr:MAG: rSAM-associated Gly-rich repeat protein [Synechococcus sp. XM-24]
MNRSCLLSWTALLATSAVITQPAMASFRQPDLHRPLEARIEVLRDGAMGEWFESQFSEGLDSDQQIARAWGNGNGRAWGNGGAAVRRAWGNGGGGWGNGGGGWGNGGSGGAWGNGYRAWANGGW